MKGFMKAIIALRKAVEWFAWTFLADHKHGNPYEKREEFTWLDYLPGYVAPVVIFALCLTLAWEFLKGVLSALGL